MQRNQKLILWEVWRRRRQSLTLVYIGCYWGSCTLSVEVQRFGRYRHSLMTSPLVVAIFPYRLELSNLQKLKKSNRPDGIVTLFVHLNFYTSSISYIPAISSFSAFMDFHFFSSLIILRKPVLYKTHTEF